MLHIHMFAYKLTIPGNVFRFRSMPLETSLIASVQNWLWRELEVRGIDAAIYSRYILSILLQDGFESDFCEESCPIDYQTRRKLSFSVLCLSVLSRTLLNWIAISPCLFPLNKLKSVDNVK